jgi:predicted MFS family arabinose efflux permease
VIPAMALITSSVHPWQRGSFMSLNSSVQMAGSALAALFAGMILQVSPQGKILNYPWVGLVAIVATVACLWLVGRIKPAAQAQ